MTKKKTAPDAASTQKNSKKIGTKKINKATGFLTRTFLFFIVIINSIGFAVWCVFVFYLVDFKMYTDYSISCCRIVFYFFFIVHMVYIPIGFASSHSIDVLPTKKEEKKRMQQYGKFGIISSASDFRFMELLQSSRK